MFALGTNSIDYLTIDLRFYSPVNTIKVMLSVAN